MTPKLVKEAMLSGMEMSLSDIDKIANNPESPTFENTIEQMERSGKLLSDVYPYYGILSSNMSSPEFRKIQGELAPKLSQYSSSINQNEKLFERVSAIYKASKTNPLESDQQRVLDLTYKSFAMNGAALDKNKKERYTEINIELSKLYSVKLKAPTSLKNTCPSLLIISDELFSIDPYRAIIISSPGPKK